MQSLKQARPALLDLRFAEIEVSQVFAVFEKCQPLVAHQCIFQGEFGPVLAVLEIRQAPPFVILKPMRESFVRFLQSLKWASPASVTCVLFRPRNVRWVQSLK